MQDEQFDCDLYGCRSPPPARRLSPYSSYRRRPRLAARGASDSQDNQHDHRLAEGVAKVAVSSKFRDSETWGRVDDNLENFARLIEAEHDTLLSRWRRQLRQLASARQLDTPTLNDHIPQFLRELVGALRSGSAETAAPLSEGSPPAHGSQRFADGFDIVEVVSEYNILRSCLHDLADSNHITLQGTPFHLLNQVLDEAVGLAVKTFVSQRDREIQERREEYLAFIAHDLRTPLNAISLSADVLEVKLADQLAAPATARLFKTLHRSVQQLENLVDKVLEENSHLQEESGVKLERRIFDLWPLVEALIRDLRPIADSGKTQLINDIPNELLVDADASLLRRVLQNLVTNAIKYAPGGQIKISARDRENSAIEISVTDDGDGIPDHRLEKIFEKGETDPANIGGTGLGLAIVKTFVEAHGGTITVESAAGSGSTFVFTLPNR